MDQPVGCWPGSVCSGVSQLCHSRTACGILGNYGARVVKARWLIWICLYAGASGVMSSICGLASASESIPVQKAKQLTTNKTNTFDNCNIYLYSYYKYLLSIVLYE